MRKTTQAAKAAFAALLLVWLCSCTEGPTSTERPGGTAPLATSIPENSVYLFDDADFHGTVTQLQAVTTTPNEVIRDFGRDRRMTSARWNLPPGVVVVLYERLDGTGDQLALWGRGEFNSVLKWKMNDKLSNWAWYNVGSTAQPASTETAPLSARPAGARPTMPLPVGTIEMYNDRDFKGTLTTLGPVGSMPQATFHPVAQANDQMTSLRWNLPPGTIVVLYEDVGGMGRQLALWGSGEFASVIPQNFNDIVSTWAWYDVSMGYQRDSSY